MKPFHPSLQRNLPLLILLWFGGTAAAAGSGAQSSDLNRMRSIAEAQHQIVMILIKKGDFAGAAEEAGKIFQMNWPEDQEQVLLKELLAFSDQFRHKSQPALALRLLEANLGFFKTDRSKAAIWKDRGYILESMGEDDKAIQCFREAQRLEGKTKKTSR